MSLTSSRIKTKQWYFAGGDLKVKRRCFQSISGRIHNDTAVLSESGSFMKQSTHSVPTSEQKPTQQQSDPTVPLMSAKIVLFLVSERKWMFDTARHESCLKMNRPLHGPDFVLSAVDHRLRNVSNQQTSRRTRRTDCTKKCILHVHSFQKC